MPKLKLIEPGKRKNATFYARGTVAGRRVELDTGETDPRRARRFAEAAEERLIRESAEPERGQVSFTEAADLWLAAGRRSKNDQRYVAKLKSFFGQKQIHSIKPRHIAEAGALLYPKAKPQTVNRQVRVPLAAVLHYAAENDLCPYVVVNKLPEPRPVPRPISRDDLARLIAAAELSALRLLLLLLYCHGWRISECLRLAWSDIDLAAGLVRVQATKSKAVKLLPLHPVFAAELAAVPLAARGGRVFPWASRGGADKHLRRLAKALNITFTAHMARWAFASDLNDRESSTMDIAAAGTWTSTKSVERYIATNRPRARAVLAKLVPPAAATEVATASGSGIGGELGEAMIKAMKS